MRKYLILHGIPGGPRNDPTGAPWVGPESGYSRRRRGDGAGSLGRIGTMACSCKGYGLADDVYAARIIVGTLGNEVLVRGNNVSGTGERRIGVAERSIGTGEQRISAEERSIGTGEQRISVGERKIGAGERRISAAERRITSGNEVSARGNDRIGTGEQLPTRGNQVSVRGTD